jgi:hypothetical protein
MKFNIDLKHVDLRPFGTLQAVATLRKYLEIMETQMEDVHRNALANLDAKRPQNDDEVDVSVFREQEDILDSSFVDNLIPTMRYSFVVFIHTILETHLQDFCAVIGRERNIPIVLSDLSGNAIEQTRIYQSWPVSLFLAPQSGNTFATYKKFETASFIVMVT